jgi:hypothetical protein
VIFELSDPLPSVDDAPKFGRYAGSETNSVVSKTQRTLRMTTRFVEVSLYQQLLNISINLDL